MLGVLHEDIHPRFFAVQITEVAFLRCFGNGGERKLMPMALR